MAGRRRLTAAEIDAQIPAALKREARARTAGLRAVSVHYDSATRSVSLVLSNGCTFGLPTRLIPPLARATSAQLAAVELSPSGSGLRWDGLDADIGVPELLLSMMPRAERIRELARAAGRSRSRSKAIAARENGRKGGRPRGRVPSLPGR